MFYIYREYNNLQFTYICCTLLPYDIYTLTLSNLHYKFLFTINLHLSRYFLSFLLTCPKSFEQGRWYRVKKVGKNLWYRFDIRFKEDILQIAANANAEKSSRFRSPEERKRERENESVLCKNRWRSARQIAGGYLRRCSALGARRASLLRSRFN